MLFVVLLSFINTNPTVVNKQVQVDSLAPYQPLSIKDNNTITIALNTSTLIYDYIDYLPLLMVSMVVLVGIIVTGRNNAFIIILLALPFLFIFFKGIYLIVAIMCLLALPFIYITIKGNRYI